MKQTRKKVKTKKQISKKQKKKASLTRGSSGKGALKAVPLEVLVDEIIRRGWEVELSRG